MAVVVMVTLLVICIVLVLCGVLTIFLVHDWAIVSAIVGGLFAALCWCICRFFARFTTTEYSLATTLRLISITRRGLIFRTFDVSYVPLVAIRDITKSNGATRSAILSARYF